MKELLTSRKANILFGVIACIIVVAGIVGPMITIKKPSHIVTPADLQAAESVSNISLSPDSDQTLDPNQVQTFVVSFPMPIQEGAIIISLVENIPQTGRQTPIPFTSSFDDSQKNLTIITKNPIGPSREYDLSIKSVKDKKELLNAHYLSGIIEPTPIPNNNPALQKYLPYQTKTYILEYDPTRNIYIFHFIYDPQSTDDIGTQFGNAKNQATNFIQGKGIDISSLIIDWQNN